MSWRRNFLSFVWLRSPAGLRRSCRRCELVLCLVLTLLWWVIGGFVPGFVVVVSDGLLVSCSRVVRKSIARVLIVMNQKQKENLRKLYKVWDEWDSSCCCFLIIVWSFRTRSTSLWTFARRGLVPSVRLWPPTKRTWRLRSSWGSCGPSPCGNLPSKHKLCCLWCQNCAKITQSPPETWSLSFLSFHHRRMPCGYQFYSAVSLWMPCSECWYLRWRVEIWGWHCQDELMRPFRSRFAGKICWPWLMAKKVR